MKAFVDESIRSREHLYVVAAALIVPDGLDVGEALSRIPHGRAPRFHWRNESDAQRMRMLDLVRELGLRSIATCYVADRPRWQERGRLKAFGRLLWELKQERVLELVIESRGEPNDGKDRQMIARAQRAGSAMAEMAYRFERPHKNPLLWLPDALAGAVGASYADSVDRYLDRLGAARPHIIDVEP
jgi:hypothetical protein